MPVVRRKLEPSDVAPVGLRYNETTGEVETLINGVWTSSPEADPRTQTTIPALQTANPRCDAATNAMLALKGQIDKILLAIDQSNTLYALAALVLGLFEFGPFAIFVSLALALAGYMLSAGTAAIEASLTPTAWDDFKCIMYCHMDSAGRIAAGDMGNIQADINDQIGGVGAFILVSMLNLAGHGGINNLAALGSATGDCSGCTCAANWCRVFDFSLGALGWLNNTDLSGIFGTWDGVWVGTNAIDTLSNPDISHHGVYIFRTFPSRTLTRIAVHFDYTKGFIDTTSAGSFVIFVNGTAVVSRSFASLPSPVTDYMLEWTGTAEGENVAVVLFASRDNSVPYSYGGVAHILTIQLEGDGENPFGEDNC